MNLPTKFTEALLEETDGKENEWLSIGHLSTNAHKSLSQ